MSIREDGCPGATRGLAPAATNAVEQLVRSVVFGQESEARYAAAAPDTKAWQFGVNGKEM